MWGWPKSLVEPNDERSSALAAITFANRLTSVSIWLRLLIDIRNQDSEDRTKRACVGHWSCDSWAFVRLEGHSWPFLQLVPPFMAGYAKALVRHFQPRSRGFLSPALADLFAVKSFMG